MLALALSLALLGAGAAQAQAYEDYATAYDNLIGAMETFRAIVLRGGIRNADLNSVNTAASSLELIPNCNGVSAPTEFSIRFVDDGIMVEYSVKADLGQFLVKDYNRRILEERLAVNEKLIFQRDDALTVELPAVINRFFNNQH